MMCLWMIFLRAQCLHLGYLVESRALTQQEYLIAPARELQGSRADQRDLIGFTLSTVSTAWGLTQLPISTVLKTSGYWTVENTPSLGR